MRYQYAPVSSPRSLNLSTSNSTVMLIPVVRSSFHSLVLGLVALTVVAGFTATISSETRGRKGDIVGITSSCSLGMSTAESRDAVPISEGHGEKDDRSLAGRNGAEIEMLSDDEFEVMIKSELELDPLALEYPKLFQLAPRAITNWRIRYKGNQKVWKRLFKKDRVFKEFVEAAPIMDAVLTLVEESDEDNFTIIDLASGKGFLSMFLSELLPPEKVGHIVLMDKSWPMNGMLPKEHHISSEHIYGIRSPDTNQTYFDTWPIPLVTSKQDLKQKSSQRTLTRRFFNQATGPIVVLAVHLCGTLSLKAVEMFNKNESVKFFALKPCCLPPMVHANRDEIFTLGAHHSFDSKLVCGSGKWSGKKWIGPPRWHLENRFNVWVDNLFQGIEHAEQKTKKQVVVQRNGGYQNTFIFGERIPVTSQVWDRLKKVDVDSDVNDC